MKVRLQCEHGLYDGHDTGRSTKGVTGIIRHELCPGGREVEIDYEPLARALFLIREGIDPEEYTDDMWALDREIDLKYYCEEASAVFNATFGLVG